jgi:hypothetical protein
MSVFAEAELIIKEKAPPVKKKGGAYNDDSNTEKIISAYEFSRVFANHVIEWTMRRRENRLTPEDDELRRDLRMQVELRNYMMEREIGSSEIGQSWLPPKKPKPKKAYVTPLKDPSEPFEPHGTHLSVGARKRMNDVRWVKPGRTKRIRGGPLINLEKAIKPDHNKTH